MVDMTGKLVYQGKASGKQLRINTQNFAKGQYFLIIKGLKPMKFIKE
nr:hypothetical protein [Chryseobacterium profundimaris]